MAEKNLQRHMFKIGGIVVLILLMAYLLIPDSVWQSGVVPIGKRQQGDVLTFKTLDGTGKWSLAEHSGKVVLVNYWATWCRPCIEEMPLLARIYNDYRDKQFELIGVTADNDLSIVSSFLEKNPVPYPIYVPDSNDPVVGGSFYILPAALIYDKEGRLAKKYTGMVDEATLRADIETLVAE